MKHTIPETRIDHERPEARKASGRGNASSPRGGPSHEPARDRYRGAWDGPPEDGVGGIAGGALVALVVIILLLAIATVAHGQQLALDLDAPESVKAGELAVVDLKTAAKFSHVKIRQVITVGGRDFLSAETIKPYKDSTLHRYVFSSTGGRYQVEADTYDPDGGINSETRIVEFTGGAPGRPTDPPPIGDLDQLRNLARASAESLRDQATAGRLAKALASVAPAATVGETQAAVQAAIVGVLAEREGDSLAVDWLGGFRRPLEEAIEKHPPATPAEYVAMIHAVAEGLAGARVEIHRHSHGGTSHSHDVPAAPKRGYSAKWDGRLKWSVEGDTSPTREKLLRHLTDPAWPHKLDRRTLEQYTTQQLIDIHDSEPNVGHDAIGAWPPGGTIFPASGTRSSCPGGICPDNRAIFSRPALLPNVLPRLRGLR